MEGYCQESYGCGGKCWLNVAGSFGIWKIFAGHCEGSLREKNLLEEAFFCERPREDVVKEFNLTEDEAKIILNNSWR